MMNFNHFDGSGNAVMVDVSAKQPTMRTAVAISRLKASPEIVSAIRAGGIAKGDVYGVARLAAIMAVKKTPELIPLSHSLAIHSVSVDFDESEADGTIEARCTVKAFERTGVEMEAMTGASIAALAIYDMCKGSDKSIEVTSVRLLFKDGGKSGCYRSEEK